MKRLTILLGHREPGAQPSARYALSGADGALVEASEALLSKMPKAQAVYVCLPQSRVSLRRVKIPAGLRKSEAQGALRGLLEEHLLGEPAELHMAEIAKDPSGSWIGVCDRRWLGSWMGALGYCGLRPKSILCEALPGTKSTAYARIDPVLGDVALLSGPTGAACLPLAPGCLPAGCELRCEPALAAKCQQLFGQPLIEEPWARLAALPWEAGAGFAQFEFAQSGAAIAKAGASSAAMAALESPSWRWARAGAAALVCAATLAIWTQARQQRIAIDSRKEALARMAAEAFPGMGAIVDPLAQSRKAYAKMASQNPSPEGDDFDPMLSALGAADGAEASKIEYERGALIAWARNPAAAKAALEAAGYAVSEAPSGALEARSQSKERK